MVDIISEKRIITKCQNSFIKRLKSICDQKVHCKLGYQGASSDVIAHYSSKYNFWFTAYEEKNRYWNAFGIGEPLANKSNSITVEINIPFSEVNRNIGGVFGQNNKGEILLLHRGKIGGGRVGIGKNLFFEQFRGDEFILANDDGIENEFCLIGSILSKYFPRQLADFISNVERIKNINLTTNTGFSKLNDYKFSNEHFGKNEVGRSKITVNRIHGIVVNALAKTLEEKGLKVGNDRNRDLFIFKGNKIKTLFEIKANSSTQSLYAAVGQLLIYSIPIVTKVKLVMVVPNKLTNTVTNRLNHWGIDILYYSWENDEPQFKGLDSFI